MIDCALVYCVLSVHDTIRAGLLRLLLGWHLVCVCVGVGVGVHHCEASVMCMCVYLNWISVVSLLMHIVSL